MKKYKTVRSWGETFITQFLNQKNVIYFKEYTFNDCLSENNKKLRFDFYLPEYNLLIEYQGKHHYEPVNKGYRAKKVTATTKIRDKIKADYAYNNKIALFEIPYWEKKNIEHILTKLLFQ